MKKAGNSFWGLFDKLGTAVVKDIFKLSSGSTLGDMTIPDNLAGDIYFLVAYSSVESSPEQVSITKLRIDPEYSNQWVVETSAKDSISVSGMKNELFVVLRDISGMILKNEQLRYQLKNGSEIIEKGKVKTDENGKVTIPFTIPGKTNGEPFICELSDSKDEWKHEAFLSLRPLTPLLSDSILKVEIWLQEFLLKSAIRHLTNGEFLLT